MSAVYEADPQVAYAAGASGPIAYRDTRPDLSETMVFVHGLNMAAGVWDQVIAQLHSFRCIALDLRGHGLSVRRGPYGVEDYLADLSAVVAATKVEDFQLVGVSLGGLINCVFARRHVALVRSVVAFGSGLIARHSGLEPGMARLREVGVADYFKWSLPRGSLPPNVREQVRDKVVELAVTGREDVLMVEDIIRSTFERDLGYMLPEPVGRPVLVVNGEYDNTYTPDGGQELATVAGGRWELLPNAGHIIPLELPARCAELVSDFYHESHPASPPSAPTSG